MDGRPSAQRDPSAWDGGPNERRKIRKGTQSCWECKRRKIRCAFATPVATVCDGCRSRGTSCVSQEFFDKRPPAPVSTRNGSQIGSRLSRLEALVDTLAKNAGMDDVLEPPSRMPPQARGEAETETDTQPSTSDSSAVHDERVGHEPLLKRLKPAYPDTTSKAPVSGKHANICHELLQAWPSKAETDAILSCPGKTNNLFHGMVCIPYSSFSQEDAPSPRTLLQPPSPDSNPVVIARRLLQLSTYLQGMPPSAYERMPLDVSRQDLMSRAMEAATRLVTSNDELASCIEGIECIMLESMYENNAGNLRRAWLSMRRALVFGQTMRLSQGMQSPLVRFLEPQTRARIDPAIMWFRLNQSDRYLSMMLGLPQGSLDNDFASPEALESCSQLDYLERIECHAGSLILQRNDANRHDLDATRKVDELLHRASASMPARWWLTPELTASPRNGMDEAQKNIRTMTQLAHYNILIQLHLPHLLQPNAHSSKCAVVNASRELLSRFLSFRSANSSTCYCRGVDFLAFIASTALCLAHIDSRRQHELCGDRASAFPALTHQRMTDRGMMEGVLEIMTEIERSSNDAIASRITSILKPLLDIEDDSAVGGKYHASSSSEVNGEELECGGQVTDNGHGVQIYIPYYGTVKIEHGRTATTATESISCALQEEFRGQGGTNSTSPAGYQLGSLSVNPDWTAVPSHFDLFEEAQLPTLDPDDDEFTHLDQDEAHHMQLLVPGLTAGVEDWALQGVDMTFFDSLLSGVEPGNPPSL